MSDKTAFEKIEEGLKEALEIARGNAEPAKVIADAHAFMDRHDAAFKELASEIPDLGKALS